MSETLTYFNETPLQVARLGGLNGRIHETLPATHRVEEELSRSQPREETVRNKSTRSRLLGCNHSNHRQMRKIATQRLIMR